MILYASAPTDFARNLGLALQTSNLNAAHLAHILKGKPDKSTIGRWLKGNPSQPRDAQVVPRIESALDVKGLLLPFEKFLDLNPRLNEYHRALEVIQHDYPNVTISGLSEGRPSVSTDARDSNESSRSLQRADTGQDTLLVISPSSFLRSVEETLRRTIFDVPYFRLYHNMSIKFTWDPLGFVRMDVLSKYAVQNRTSRRIAYKLFVGLWNVRGESIDRHSAITRLVCACPNLPSETELNFALVRPEDLEAHETVVRQARRLERYIVMPPREALEIETGRIICGYAIDQEPIFVHTPTGKFSITIDVSECPDLSVRAAPLHSLPEYFQSVPNEKQGVFQWVINTGLLPQQGVLLWWQGAPPTPEVMRRRSTAKGVSEVVLPDTTMERASGER